MADETPVQSDLRMDRSHALGNSQGPDGRRMLHVQAFPFGAPLPDEEYDAVTCTQVDPSTVAFEFRTGGATGTIIQTITIEYTEPTAIPFNSVVYS